MPSIFISPVCTASSPSSAVELVVNAPTDTWYGTYNALEVWSSRSESGIYSPLTAPEWLPAVLSTGLVAGDLINLHDKVLSFTIKDRYHVDVTFSGTDPLTTAQVAAQINSQSRGLLLADGSTGLVVQSTEPGGSVKVYVTPSDSSVLLKFYPNVAYGRSVAPRLISGVSSYSFTDYYSEVGTTWYRTRLVNTITGVNSPFSAPVPSAAVSGISSARLVVGYLSLAELDGKPVPNREVSLSSEFDGSVVDGYALAGGHLVGSTNSLGRVEFTLVRGQQYSLSIAGTNLARTLRAPTLSSVTSFSLLDPTYSDQVDYFKVRVPQLVDLPRRA